MNLRVLGSLPPIDALKMGKKVTFSIPPPLILVKNLLWRRSSSRIYDN